MFSGIDQLETAKAELAAFGQHGYVQSWRT
jgi:hypothetical protein